MTKRKNRGFTLIELMVVVAVVAILATIALPTYNEQMRKSRRSQALQGLSDLQLRQERWRANHKAYATDLGTMPASAHYTFAITATSETGYTLTATPVAGGAQASDRCGTYTFKMTAGKLEKSAGETSGCGL